MRDGLESTEADLGYEEAYAAHHQVMDLTLALVLYRGVIDVFPNTLQAESARLQLLKIVDVVVPIAEIVDTLQTLATTHLESTAAHDSPQDRRSPRGLRHQQDRTWEHPQPESQRTRRTASSPKR